LVRTCSVPRGALCGKKRKSLIYLVSPLGVPTANNIKLLSSQTSAKATTGGKREFKSSQQANAPPPNEMDWRRAARFCHNRSDLLTEKERVFIDQLMRRDWPLSQKQERWLSIIEARLRG
jgi:hypothetical protein